MNSLQGPIIFPGILAVQSERGNEGNKPGQVGYASRATHAMWISCFFGINNSFNAMVS